VSRGKDKPVFAFRVQPLPHFVGFFFGFGSGGEVVIFPLGKPSPGMNPPHSFSANGGFADVGKCFGNLGHFDFLVGL
jgi:hypothetical protein